MLNFWISCRTPPYRPSCSSVSGHRHVCASLHSCTLSWIVQEPWSLTESLTALSHAHARHPICAALPICLFAGIPKLNFSHCKCMTGGVLTHDEHALCLIIRCASYVILSATEAQDLKLIKCSKDCPNNADHQLTHWYWLQAACLQFYRSFIQCRNFMACFERRRAAATAWQASHMLLSACRLHCTLMQSSMEHRA